MVIMIICRSIESLLKSMELNQRFEKAHQGFGERKRGSRVIPRIESYTIPGIESYQALIDIHGPYSYVPDFLVLAPQERSTHWNTQYHVTVLPTGVYTRTFAIRPQDGGFYEREFSGRLIMTNESSTYISDGDDKIRKAAIEHQLEKMLENPEFGSSDTRFIDIHSRGNYIGNNKIIYGTDKCLEEIREGLHKLGAKRIER